MSAAVIAFLALAVIAVWTGAVGTARAPSAADRVHFLGPPGIVAPVALTVAAWLSDVTTAIALRMTLLAVLLVLQAPITAHVLGRATWIRGAATRGREA